MRRGRSASRAAARDLGGRREPVGGAAPAGVPGARAAAQDAAAGAGRGHRRRRPGDRRAHTGTPDTRTTPAPHPHRTQPPLLLVRIKDRSTL